MQRLFASVHRPGPLGFWRFASVCAALALAAPACTHVALPPTSPVQPEDHLSVAGEGRETVAPDVVIASVGVDTRAADARVAVEEANKRMRLLITNLSARGIAPADMQTSEFSVSYEPPQLPYPPPPPSPPPAPLPRSGKPGAPAEPVPPPAPEPKAPAGLFRVDNTLRLKIRNVEQTGELLALAIESGANNIWGIMFTIDDPKPQRQKARAKAVADAIAKAKELAAASGVQLGRVLSIDDQENGPAQPMFMEARNAGPVPIQATSVEVSHRVHVRFALVAPEKDKPAEKDDSKD